MAFGIDDALAALASGINLTDTLVQTISRYRAKKIDYDFEQLIQEVKVTTLKKIDDADLALTQFERTLLNRKIDINKRLEDVIAETSFWRPFEQHRLSQVRAQFNAFSDSVYSSGDDIAALVRCKDQVQEMGLSVVETTKSKHEFQERLLYAKSLKEAIELLRGRLADYKNTLSKS